MAGPAPTPQDPRQRFLVPVLGACGIVAALMQTVVVPLLPDLPALTGSSASTVSWTLTATLLSGAVCTPLLGRAGDMFGKKRMLVVAMSVLSIGSLMCALTSDIGVLIVGRTLQGMATAVVPLGISILRDELPPAKVGGGVAMMSSTLGIGAAVGLPLAGLVVDHADWHAMFWGATALALLVLVSIVLVVRESPVRNPGRFDVIGSLGLAAFLVCLLLAVSKGTAWGWTSTRTLGLLGAAVLILLAWGAHQWRASTPLVDLRVTARPAVLLPNIAALFIGFSFYANSLSTAQLVQTPKDSGYGLGVSVAVGSLCLLPGGVMMVALSPISTRLTATRGPRFCLGVGAILLGLGYVVRIFTSHELWTIILGATVVASGTAMCYSALPMLVIRAIPAAQTAAANGINALMRTIGQAVCSAVVAAVLTSYTIDVGGLVLPALHAYMVVFVIAGVVACCALVACLCIPEPTGPTAAAIPPQPSNSARESEPRATASSPDPTGRT
ncbi:MFS transporter [Embleya sp. NBC_00888]|uniref:MFS transporter n=1 Tax=Embleya sp. NBC_00888 TaxID=2975960 RepID=UPI00386BB7BC|nr:MFS transporter [Embleya sp. NBC_00888]